MEYQKSIYFIDDDENILKLLADCVKCVEGISISYKTFNSAKECILQLEIDQNEQKLPDCVYTDLNMPGMDGLEVLSQLAKRFPSIHLGVISSEPELIPSPTKGNIEVWKKPVNLMGFVERLQNF